MMISDRNELSVMIIEPNLSMRSIMRGIVRNLGVSDIQEASNIEAGYKNFKDSPVDLIFTDWSEDMDALQFLRMVRRSDDSPDQRVPIVVVTANKNLSEVSRARDSGMTEYLAKPISQKLVLSRIKSAIGNPRMFVDTGNFFGPDRRRRRLPIEGKERRAYIGEERRIKDADYGGRERRQSGPDYMGEDVRGDRKGGE